MSKRQLRNKHRRPAAPGRSRRLVAVLTLSIVCIVSVTLVAKVNSRKKAAEPAAASVASFAAAQPSKEYVYAGGKLIATEEPVGCSYSLSPTSQAFGASGGIGSVSVTATAGCPWTATSNATWITITAGATGGGDGLVSYSVAANTAAARTGTITIAGQSFSVDQAAASCAYSISSATASFTSSGGTGTVGVTANAGCGWTATSNDAWIAITGGSSGSGNGTVSYSVAANTGPARTGTMTIAGQSFTVSQAAAAGGCTGSGTGNGLRGEYFNNMTLTGSPAVTRTDAVLDLNWGTGSPDPTIPSDQFSARWTGQVQPQCSEAYTFYVFSDDGVRVWVNNQLIIDKWFDQFGPEWSSAPISLVGGQNYDIKVEFYENAGGAEIHLKWSSTSIAKQTIPQSQLLSAAGCTYSTSPAGQFFASSGGTGTVGVTANAGCGWTATSNDAWIAITGGSSGSGNGTVSYSVAANTGPARTGTMTIAGQSFTVIQEAAVSVPAAPTLLSATPSASSVTLTWQNNTQADYIQVERKVGSGAYSVIATLFNASATSYVDGSLGPGTYTYRLRCFVGNGTASPYSNEMSATIGGSNPPNPPTNLVASLGAGLSVNLAWTDNSADETGFTIERKTGAGTYSVLATVGSNITNYTDTSVSYSTTYAYRVKAINGTLESAYSNESSVTTGPPPPPNAPSDLAASVISGTRVDLAWLDNSSDEDGFKVERRTGAGAFSLIATLGANATTYSDTSVVASTQYTYRVRSFSTAGGDSAPSNEVTVTTPAPPSPPTEPTGLAATATSASQINLAWTDNSTNEDGFKIERKEGLGGTYAQIATTGVNAASYSDTGLSASTTYFYRVRAYNAAGDSAYSNEATATTQAASACAQVSVFSGSGAFGYAEGSGTAAQWNSPVGGVVAKDPATGLYALFVADTGNNRIRKIALEGAGAGASSLVAGDGLAGYNEGKGKPLNARYNGPRGIAAITDGSGTATVLVIADTNNHRIRKLTWNGSGWTSAKLSGSGTAGLKDGSCPTCKSCDTCQFNAPQSVAAAPDGFIYVADTGNGVIRKVSPSTGDTSTIVGVGTFSSPAGITAASSGLLYVSDSINHKVYQVTTAGAVTAIAGSGTAGFADGTATAAMFNSPAQLVWANPPSGAVLLVADQSNNRIRALALATNAVTTLAGSGIAGFADGSCTAAQFNAPRGAAYSSSTGAVYIIDTSNHRIRKVL